MSEPKPPATTAPDDPSSENGSAMPIEGFTALASKLVSIGLHREAIGLYETAVTLYPHNLALKINLARVRDMKRRADAKLLQELSGDIQERRGREDLLAQHALGLGELHYRRDELDHARDVLEFARSRNPNLQRGNLLLARIHVGLGEYEHALELAEDARRANPFSEEVQSLLGRLYLETGDHARAANAFLDALYLTGDETLDDHPFYAVWLRHLLPALGHAEKDLGVLLAERGGRMKRLTDRLERRSAEWIQRERARDDSLLERLRAAAQSPRSAELRRFPFLAKVSDEDLALVDSLLEHRKIPAGDLVFAEKDSPRKLFLIDKGEVAIRRNTPFGELVFASRLPGQVCGEMDFLDGHGCSADAVALQDTQVFTLARPEADRLFRSRRGLAVQCLSFFWRELAENIRATNERMKSFFVDEALVAERKIDDQRRDEAEKVIIDIQRKLALFHETGLTTGELDVLATLSTEERHGAGGLIFSEGDPGNKLYVVLDGKVRISKAIPGVGEEALAILERGDFFGEMALVDDKPRSADARAHEGGTTILAIDKHVLDDILAQDEKGAIQLLTIMCRILSQRLREVNETIVKWKIMSGGF